MIFNRKSCHFSWIQMHADWSRRNMVLKSYWPMQTCLSKLNLNTCSVIMSKHGFNSGCVLYSCNCPLSVPWSDAVLWQQAGMHCLFGTEMQDRFVVLIYMGLFPWNTMVMTTVYILVILWNEHTSHFFIMPLPLWPPCLITQYSGPSNVSTVLINVSHRFSYTDPFSLVGWIFIALIWYFHYNGIGKVEHCMETYIANWEPEKHSLY